ncbi:unnamed protein product [Pedinophyceae sp. YPF-701]|nr:unnamed protein product [Pedinophyceae sp. YPF-701]
MPAPSTLAGAALPAWAQDALRSAAQALSSVNLTAATVAQCVLAGLVLFVVLEQWRFKHKARFGKGSVPTTAAGGTPVPVVGGLIEMIYDPFRFWDNIISTAMQTGGLCWHSIFGVYTLLLADIDDIRQSFSRNNDKEFMMAIHPNAHWILGPKNIAFLHGPMHKELRRSFVGLFTRKALEQYVAKQDGIIRDWIRPWARDTAAAPTEVRMWIRDMNAWTSQEVFAGPYLGDHAAREKFSHAYIAMTEGFLAFPVCLPGTAVWRGRQGRYHILDVLEKAAAAARERDLRGEPPVCLMDYWAHEVNRIVADAEKSGSPLPEFANNHRMADVVMDFLFASQDASTASLVWVLALMADHPDVYQRVREEQLRVRGADAASLEKPITGEVLEKMTYTRQVVKEILRFRPAAPMVPQWSMSDQTMNGTGYTCPKGALVMPSLIAACHTGFPNPEKFDPDRFDVNGRNEGDKYGKHWLPFGLGAHYCVGREYAQNHLAAFLAILSTTYDIERERTPKSDEYIYLPTIYPADSRIRFKSATVA